MAIRVKMVDRIIKDIPEDMIYGVIHKRNPTICGKKMSGALIRHDNGKIYGWDDNEFEIIEQGDE